jgi:hypothetical protein
MAFEDCRSEILFSSWLATLNVINITKAKMIFFVAGLIQKISAHVPLKCGGIFAVLDDGVALEHLAWPNLRARRSANSFHIRFHPLQGCIQTDR